MGHNSARGKRCEADNSSLERCSDDPNRDPMKSNTATDAAPRRVPPDWPNRSASRSVSVGPLDWHVQVAGTGPTVVLLHGTGASAHSWADVFPNLASVATVVAPDLPGHGFTTGASPASLTLPQVAADLEALVDALDLPSPTLIAGHSAGAALAIRWVLSGRRAPQAIVGFAPSLIAPPAVYGQFIAPFVNPLATSPLAAWTMSEFASRTGLVDWLLHSTGSAVPAAQRARYATLFRNPSHVRGAMGFMAAADLPGLLDEAKSLTVPMTFVIGSYDHWIPERPLRAVIERAFPAATVIGWEGGHLLHEVRHVEAAALLRSVLDSGSVR
jgi:magnesium chelatase accessory protein